MPVYPGAPTGPTHPVIAFQGASLTELVCYQTATRVKSARMRAKGIALRRSRSRARIALARALHEEGELRTTRPVTTEGSGPSCRPRRPVQDRIPSTAPLSATVDPW